MRAGKLDKIITIDAYSAGTPDDYGVSAAGWATIATVRAQILQSSTEEYLRGYGEGANTAILFRTRWLDGVTTECRIGYDCRVFNVREIKEIGRHAGLEFRCEEVRQ